MLSCVTFQISPRTKGTRSEVIIRAASLLAGLFDAKRVSCMVRERLTV